MINVKKLSFCIACSAIVSVLSLTNVDARIEFGLGRGRVSLDTAMQIAGATLNPVAGGNHFILGNAMQPGDQIMKENSKSAKLEQADIDAAINQMNLINDAWRKHESVLSNMRTVVSSFSPEEVVYEMINWSLPRRDGEAPIKLEVDINNHGQIDGINNREFTTKYMNALNQMKKDKIFNQKAEMDAADVGIGIAREISGVMKAAFTSLKNALRAAAGQVDPVARLRAEIAALQAFHQGMALDRVNKFIPERALSQAQGAVPELQIRLGGGLEAGAHIRKVQGLVDAMRYVTADLATEVVGDMMRAECERLQQYMQEKHDEIARKERNIAALLAAGNQLVVQLGETIAEVVSMCGLAGESLRNMQREHVNEAHLLDLAWSLERIQQGNWAQQLKPQLEDRSNNRMFYIVQGILPEQLQAPAEAAVTAQ